MRHTISGFRKPRTRIIALLFAFVLTGCNGDRLKTEAKPTAVVVRAPPDRFVTLDEVLYTNRRFRIAAMNRESALKVFYRGPFGNIAHLKIPDLDDRGGPAFWRRWL